MEHQQAQGVCLDCDGGQERQGDRYTSYSLTSSLEEHPHSRHRLLIEYHHLAPMKNVKKDDNI